MQVAGLVCTRDNTLAFFPHPETMLEGPFFLISPTMASAAIFSPPSPSDVDASVSTPSILLLAVVSLTCNPLGVASFSGTQLEVITMRVGMI